MNDKYGDEYDPAIVNLSDVVKDESDLSSSDLPTSLVAHVRADCVILQEKKYIEEGWFIKITPSQIQLWEIAQYGGEEELIAVFPSASEAYQHAMSLC